MYTFLIICLTRCMHKNIWSRKFCNIDTVNTGKQQNWRPRFVLGTQYIHCIHFVHHVNVCHIVYVLKHPSYSLLFSLCILLPLFLPHIQQQRKKRKQLQVRRSNLHTIRLVFLNCFCCDFYKSMCRDRLLWDVLINIPNIFVVSSDQSVSIYIII